MIFFGSFDTHGLQGVFLTLENIVGGDRQDSGFDFWFLNFYLASPGIAREIVVRFLWYEIVG